MITVPLWGLLGIVAFFGAFCYFLAWGIHGKWNNVSVDDLRSELDRRIHYQEMEAIERRAKARMHARRSKYTPRPDGGEGIRIRKMNVRSTREDGRN